jgi:benzoylformate decarboxylase
MRAAASLDGGVTFSPSTAVSSVPNVFTERTEWVLGTPGASGGRRRRGAASTSRPISVNYGVNGFFLSGGHTSGIAVGADDLFYPVWSDNRTGLSQLWTAPVTVHGAVHKHGAAELAELLGAAVYGSSIPYSAQFPAEHPAFMGTFTRAQAQVRKTLEPHDLLLSLGADLLRMSVYSPIEPLPGELPVIHISERAHELGKNYRTDLAVQADVKQTLLSLLPLLRNRVEPAKAQARLQELKPKNWKSQRDKSRIEAMLAAETAPIDPQYLMLRFTETLPRDAVVVDEGLVSTYALPKFLAVRGPRDYYGLASGGLGFAVPGAVGISMALPDRPIAVLVGDGSAMYAIQGLWTAAHHRLPITYVVANNRGYRIIKERLVAFRKTDRFTGMDLRDPDLDFISLAASFGLAARRVTDPQEIAPALREAFASGRPNLVDVRVADGFGG